MEQVLGKRNILVAVDESAASDRVVDWAVENLYKSGDSFVLFHVIPPNQYIVLSADLGLEDVIEGDPEAQRRVEEHAKTFMSQRFASKLEAKGVPTSLEIIKCPTDNDSIGAVVCKRAEQLNAGAVLLAKHNKGAIKEFFVGSVTSYVTRHCQHPVICLHCD